jgi:phage terminase large subunit
MTRNLTKKTATFNIPEEAFNPAFQPFMQSRSRENHLFGGAGSGKSTAIAQKIVLCLLNNVGERIPLVRKVARTIRRSQFQTIRDLVDQWEMEKAFEFNTSDLEITCKLNKNHCFAIGLDDPEKIKSIIGLTKIWAEEATELAAEDRRQLNLRLRGFTKAPKEFILSYNPIDEHHYLNTQIHQDPNNRFLVPNPATGIPRVSLFHSTYKNNRFLDPEYIAELKALEDEDFSFYRIYTLGEWATVKGKIYDNWFEVDDIPKDYDDRIYGLDIGLTNKTALTEITRVNRDLYFRQLVYESDLLAHELISIMEGKRSNKYNDFIDAINRDAFIYCDPAAAATIKEIYNAGFNIVAADNEVVEGIRAVKGFRCHVDVESEDIKTEYRNYKWQEDRITGQTKEVPVKRFDHAMDSIRYGVFTHAQEHWQNVSSTTTELLQRFKANRKPKFYEGYGNGFRSMG